MSAFPGGVASAGWRLAGCRPVFFPFFGWVVGDLDLHVEFGWQLAGEQGAQVGSGCDLEHGARGWVLAQHVPDCPLGVEQRTQRAAWEDAVVEAEATVPKRRQLRGRAP